MSTALTTTASAHITTQVTKRARLAFSVAVAEGTPTTDESFTATSDGGETSVEEVVNESGVRFHIVTAPEGNLTVEYKVTASASAPARAVSDYEALELIRPSRYAESDKLSSAAHALFRDSIGDAAATAVAVDAWIHDNLRYVLGSSRPTDSAADTFLQMKGVCRDYAHLAVAFLRSMGIPARVVSVYAPGLNPMDFHAVVEVAVDGQWRVIDGTHLAPRASFIRIATGRDTADTAFLTTLAGRHNFKTLKVSVTADGQLPEDDLSTLVTLGEAYA